MNNVSASTCTMTEERIAIDEGGRCLEGLLAYDDQPRWSALIAGPHPFLGGDLDNNVVRRLLAGLATDGALALTFNYAGVGASEGGPRDWPAVMSQFWEEGRFEGEADWVEDTQSALSTLRSLSKRRLAIVGYSFGCWTVANCMATASASAAVLISPNPKRHDFSGLRASNTPLLVLCSDNEFACSKAEVVHWFETLRDPKTLVVLPASEHFFRGQEEDVLAIVKTFLRTRVKRRMLYRAATVRERLTR